MFSEKVSRRYSQPVSIAMGRLVIIDIDFFFLSKHLPESAAAVHHSARRINRKEIMQNGKHEQRIGGERQQQVLMVKTGHRQSRPYLLGILHAARMLIELTVHDERGRRRCRKPLVTNHHHGRLCPSALVACYSDPHWINLRPAAPAYNRRPHQVVNKITCDTVAERITLDADLLVLLRPPQHPALLVAKKTEPFSLPDRVHSAM